MWTWLGLLASSAVRRSGATASKYQSSCPCAVSLTACSGVTPILISMRLRWPAGTYGLHEWKLGLRTNVMWSLGTYSEITYGPMATRQRATVEMSWLGVPLGTANANGIAMYSR